MNNIKTELEQLAPVIAGNAEKEGFRRSMDEFADTYPGLDFIISSEVFEGNIGIRIHRVSDEGVEYEVYFVKTHDSGNLRKYHKNSVRQIANRGSYVEEINAAFLDQLNLYHRYTLENLNSVITLK